MSGSNCCFFTCIKVSQEADKVVWYSHFFKNFPWFIVIHTLKGFSIVSEAKVDVFFFWIPLLSLWSNRCLLSLWSNKCWQFDLWFLCLFLIFTYCWILAWWILSIGLGLGFRVRVRVIPKNRKSNSKGYKSVVAQSCGHSVMLWTVACQAPLSMGFFRQEYWSGLPFPSPGDLLDPGIDSDLPHYRQILYHLSHEGISQKDTGTCQGPAPSGSRATLRMMA